MSDCLEDCAFTHQPIVLLPQYVHRVWGGTRFADRDLPIGEVWLVHESNLIADGPAAGMTLGTAVECAGKELLGSELWDRGERRFPLLLKLLDTREWLSIQVHPDDRLAAELEGPGLKGKTEAWFAIETASDASVIAGVRADVTQDSLASAIRSGAVETVSERHPFRASEVLTVPAGTVHALGPGLFVYEIQQSSDITYRISDWNRPESAGRPLHIEQSLRAVDASLRPHPVKVPDLADGQIAEVAATEPFTLAVSDFDQKAVPVETDGQRFAIVTVISGQASLEFAGGRRVLEPLDTVLIPAAVASCLLRAKKPSRALIAWPA